MNYLPRSRTRNAHLKKVGILLAIFILGTLFFSLFNNVLITAISPLWRGENTLSRTLRETFDYFHTHRFLVAENTALQEKISSLELENQSLRLQADQSTRLLELLGRKGEEVGITSSVLTRPPQSPYDFLLIDAGEREGVILGARVKLIEGPEIGTVSEVTKHFSQIKLYSTSGAKTNAVLERYDIAVVLEGTGAGNFRISVPRDTEVVIGDRVLSADLNSSLVAVVEDVKVMSTDSFKEVLAKSPVNIFSVRTVSVLP